MRRLAIAIGILVLLAAGGCTFWKNLREDSREREQIQAAIDNYVTHSGGIDLKTVNKEIQEFNTDRDRAEVLMKFTPKQGGSALQMMYRLEREKGVWSVKSATRLVGGIETGPQVPPQGTSPKPPGSSQNARPQGRPVTPPTSNPPAPRGR